MSARRRIIPVFVPHLGCLNDCAFCNQRRISGSLSPVTPEQVRRTLDEAFDGPSATEAFELAFYGGSFTAIPSQEQEGLLGAALPFLHEGKLSGIRLSTRPDAIDGVILDRLERYGVKTIELGAQSLRDEVLALSKRGHTSKDVYEAAKLVKGRGFKLILQMMTGLPGDDDEGATYTAREICALAPDGVRIYPTVIVRDTALYEMWREGTYSEHTVEDAVRVCARLVPIFGASGIPIIRLGLNPTEDLSGGDAAGGAYHPALGELVYSRILRRRMAGLLEGIEPGSRAVIGVHKSKISQAVGQKRCNIYELELKYSLESLKITEIDCAREEIRLVFIAK